MILYKLALNKTQVKNASLQLLGMDIPTDWISFEHVDDHTVLYISDLKIGSIYLDEMDDPEDIEYLVEELVEEEQSRIREILIQSRTATLEEELEKDIKDLENWSNDFLDNSSENSDINIYVSVDHDWAIDGHWQLEEEFMDGYPTFVIKITDLRDFSHSIPLKLTESNAPEALDWVSIKTELKLLLKQLK